LRAVAAASADMPREGADVHISVRPEDCALFDLQGARIG
jgi:hypothetical protein